MPERAAVNELLQLALETTLGTLVPANRQMALFELVPTVDLDMKAFAGEGRKNAASVLSNKDWTAYKWSTKGNAGDAVSYTELPYVLSSLMGRPTPTTPAGGVNSKLWTFDAPLQGSPANPIASYSVEQGQAAHAHKVAGYVFIGITIKGTRDGVTASGDAIAQVFTPNATLSGGTTKVAMDAVLGADWTVYRDPTSTALGTTQLTRCFEWEYAYTGVYAVIWPGNKAASANTWAALVEMDPQHSAKLKLEADSQGDTGVSDARAGTTEFYRIDMLGQIIENLQVLTINGGPTGGTFTLTYKGQTTTALAFNATGAAVQTALQALSTVGTNATVAGGAGGPYTVTFAGTLGQDTTLLTHTDSLTGGVTPNVSIAATIIKREIKIDVAGKVHDKIALMDGNDLLEEELPLEVVEDTNWGHAALINVTNMLAAL